MTADSGYFWLMVALLGAGGGLLFYRFLGALHRARLLRDLATSRIRSAAQGYIELEGTGAMLDGPAVISPLTATRCLWWQYSVHKRVQSGRNSHWRKVRAGTSDALFALDDATGRCVVDPEGARVVPSRRHTWYGASATPDRGPAAGSVLLGGNYRYQEQILVAGGPVYVVGEFRTQRLQAGDDVDTEVRALLAEWKADQPRLLDRFDVDGDGHIDAREWEAARRVADMQVRREQAQRRAEHDADPAPALNVIARTAGRPFLISGIEQRRLTRRLYWQAALCFAGFVGAGAALLWLLDQGHII